MRVQGADAGESDLRIEVEVASHIAALADMLFLLSSFTLSIRPSVHISDEIASHHTLMTASPVLPLSTS
jgi:hypothetical protein